MRQVKRRASVPVLLIALALTACHGRIRQAGDGGIPFQPLPPSAYGAKVKNLLVGQPLTDAELAQITKDPSSLRSLIDVWMAQPEWRQRMLLFFKQAFQQTQVTLNDYVDPFHLNVTRSEFANSPLLLSFEEMFPRTALELMDEGRPFTEVVTTQRFMLNTPLMSLMAFADATPTNDNLLSVQSQWWPIQKYPDAGFTLEDTTSVPVSQSVDPTSPSFMSWYDPTDAQNTDPLCVEPVTQSFRSGGLANLEIFLFGERLFPNGHSCGLIASQFTPQDWSTWRMVTVRQPDAGEPTTPFWDLAALEAATELVTYTPRVGFMTTPAFFANWPTNVSNQARVTMDQAVIVALGYAFDDRGVTVPVQSSGADAEHAQPGTTCYACHQTLDPMRDFYRQSYTYSYSPRSVAPAPDAGIPTVATFTVLGSPPVQGNGVYALAQALASHPRFPVAWAQKVCRFANSASCSEDDPEFQRVVQVFVASNYDFKALMREMLSSPLVTYSSETKTAQDTGVVISIARESALCTSLSNRLGVADVCGLYGTAGLSQVATIAQAVPGDGYSRGAEAPLLPTDPNLFFESATGNICATLAKSLVDSPLSTRFQSKNADAACTDLVSSVMGVPLSDGRFAPLKAALLKHFNAALAAGATGTPALQSTFILACESPLAVSSGL